MKRHYMILTVTGKDRPGIIAEVTGIFYREGGNLEDVSMTILEGEFAMILVASMAGKAGKERLLKALRRLNKSGRLSIFWKELKHAVKRGRPHAAGTVPHILTAMGSDRTGIVHEISRLLSASRLNITDLQSQILGRGRDAVYTMLLEVDIPRKHPLKALQLRLRTLEKKLKVEIRIRPAEALAL